MNVPRVIEEAIAAHGGQDLWSRAQSVEAVHSARGFLFMAKRRKPLDHVTVRASTRRAVFTFLDFPSPGLRSELIGTEEVRITDHKGAVIAQRFRPREAFSGFRRQFKWDDLDFAYFAGYATWNYLKAPFIFLEDGFGFEELPPRLGKEGRWERVKVTFPDTMPTHCRQQVFYFDENRLLRRLDYVAEVVGRWARAAHLCDEYRDFGGLKVPTRRRVLPLFGMDDPLPGPTLVAIDIHSARLMTDE